MNLAPLNILRILKTKGYATFEQDDKNFNLNIIGIRTKDRTSNAFNDKMIIMWKYCGYWNSLVFPITTDPGHYWRKKPMNVKGTAILKEGQYRGMWAIGKHQGKYAALRQVKPCIVYRDANRDHILDAYGKTEKGLFGINHHKAGSNSTRVDKWSAGCQVQPNKQLFEFEMQLFKEGAKNWGNSFTYTLIEESDF